MISIQITNKKQNQRFEHSGGPLEFGRGARRKVERFVLNDVFASRDQLRVEELPGERIRIENLSLKQEIALLDGTELSAGTSQEFLLPVRLSIGQTTLELDWVPDGAFDKESLHTIDRPVEIGEDQRNFQSLDDLGERPAPEILAHWLETVIALQRSALGSPEFYRQTARALVELVGLDLGMVLLRRDWTWEVVARHSSSGATAHFSPALLSHVLAERRTFYQDMSTIAPRTRGLQLQGVDAVVVSPIFGLRDDTVGALYGLRNPRFPARGGRIVALEAQMVQLLAATLGSHLARAQTTRTRVEYEQFFSPKVMRELERDPSLLEGRSHEVTLLVSNLHNGDRVMEQLGPQETCRLVRDLLERLSERIVESGGVIVEYTGPGILALWNAPTRQHDHALLAAGAALAMLNEVPELNAKWQATLGEPLHLGIGLHTGAAQVGSMGSSSKFKYGVQGPEVQRTRRVQEATRQLGRPLLVSGATRDLLPDNLFLRRLGQMRVRGFHKPLPLHELHGVSATPEWISRRDAFEGALSLYENGQWSGACQALLQLVDLQAPVAGQDVASFKLMRRAWECLESPPSAFDPAISLDGK